MSDFVLHLEYLIHLHLLHLPDFGSYLPISLLILPGRRICEYFIELQHCFFKRLQLVVLGLDLHEQGIKFLD